jgi:hypothetical protein
MELRIFLMDLRISFSFDRLRIYKLQTLKFID